MTANQRSTVSELVKGMTMTVGVVATMIAALAGVGSFVSLAMRTLL